MIEVSSELTVARPADDGEFDADRASGDAM